MEMGTPQGGVLSPLLCNIVLHGMETEVSARPINDKGHIDSKGPLLIRYADDFIILTRTKVEAERKLKEINNILKIRGLKISEKKTRLVHIAEGFDFLGFNIRLRPRNGQPTSKGLQKLPSGDYYIDRNKVGLFIQPSRKSIESVKNKLRDIFKSTHGKQAKDLINEANPVIRGWANSKKAWHSSRTFRDLENLRFNLQYRWIKRTHPNKNNSWLKQRYYFNLKLGPINNRWVFRAPGKEQIFMYQFKWFPIE